MCLAVAPIPRAIVATLWVARARAKGRPRKIRAGSCIRPAPPPDSAENRLAISEIIKIKRCSVRSEIARFL